MCLCLYAIILCEFAIFAPIAACPIIGCSQVLAAICPTLFPGAYIDTYTHLIVVPLNLKATYGVGDMHAQLCSAVVP